MEPGNSFKDYMPTTSCTDTCSEMRTLGRPTQPSSSSVDTHFTHVTHDTHITHITHVTHVTRLNPT
jgi:hypothetical protein